MRDLRRIRRLLDDIWGAIDPDEPVFCECTGAWECADCSLAAPVPTAAPVAAPASTTAA